MEGQLIGDVTQREGISTAVFVRQVSGLQTGEQAPMLLHEFQPDFQSFENNVL